MSRLVGVTLLIITGFTLTFANDVSPAKNVPITVKVIVSSEQHSSEIESYMNRALRNLGDVDIDHEYPDYEIRVAHLRSEVGRTKAFGVVILSTLPERYFNPNLDESMRSFLRQNAYIYETMAIYASGFGTPLNRRCETIVADIDSGVFEQRRQSLKSPQRRTKPLPPVDASYLFEGLLD